MIISIEVLEAASRIMDKDTNHYPDLKMAGNADSYKRFHDDVMLLAETIARLATEGKAAS